MVVIAIYWRFYTLFKHFFKDSPAEIASKFSSLVELHVQYLAISFPTPAKPQTLKGYKKKLLISQFYNFTKYLQHNFLHAPLISINCPVSQ